MSLREREPDRLTEIIDGREQKGHGRRRRRLSADQLVDALMGDTWLFAAAARAVRDDADDLVRLREGPFAEAVREKLAAAGEPYSFYGRRLDGVLRAAEAARHRLHGRNTEAERYREAALNAWTDGEHPRDPVAHAQVVDLVESLIGGWEGPEARAAQMGVPIRGENGVEPVTLVVEAVELSGERVPGAWPCPREMAFTKIDPETCADIAAKAAGGPAGVRWRLVTARGRSLRTVPEAPLAAPVAVLTESLADATRLDPSLTVVAGLDGDGRLLPAEDGGDLVEFAKENGKRVVVGAGHVPHPRGRLRRVRGTRPGGRARTELPAPDVATAVRLARRRPNRRLAWGAVGMLVAVLAAAGGYTWNVRRDSSDAAARREAVRLARVLSEQVRDQVTSAPREALLKALAAQRMSPDTNGARSALLNAVHADLRLRGLLRDAPNPLRALDMAADGLTVAAAGDTARIVVWSLGPEMSRFPRKIATGGAVTALALAPDGRTLAYAERSGGVRTVALTPSGPEGALPPPQDGNVVKALRFSPDGKDLAAATGDGGLLWHGGSGTPVRFADGTDAAGLAFAPKGRSLALVGTGGDVSFWHVADGDARRFAAIDLHSPASGIAYDLDGEAAFAMTADGRVHPLEAGTGKRLREPVRLLAGSRPLSVTRDGLWVASVTDLAALGTDSLLEGETLAQEVIGSGAPVRSTAAVSADGSTTVTPAGDGVLAVHGEAGQRIVDARLAGVFGVARLPGSGKLLLLNGLFGKRAWLTVYDPRRRFFEADVSYPSRYSRSPGVLSGRLGSAVVVTEAGHVLVWRYDGGRRLIRIAELLPPSGPTRPVVALDETHGRLAVAWHDRLVIYAYDGRGQPRRISERRLQRPLYCMAVDPKRSRVVGCTQAGMSMWPLDPQGNAGPPVRLGARLAVLAAVTEGGTVVGAGPSGDVFAYEMNGADVRERTLPGEPQYIFTLTAVGDDVAYSARTGYISIVDVDSGERLLRTPIPDVSEPPFATWQDAGGLHLSLGLAATRIDMIVDPSALAAHACRLGGWSGSSPTVGDVEPRAPARVRDRPLCPAED